MSPPTHRPADERCDVLVIGAGFAGLVCAQQLAEAGLDVLVLDKRDHIGGNAHDRLDAAGVLVHPYGPHIFHTNSRRVFAYLSRFTDWRFYEHRVLAEVQGQRVPLPINRTTLQRLYGRDFDEAQAAAWLERVREPRDPVRTSEDVVLASVGRELCELFFRGYTRKQWGLDLSELSGSVAARIPTRTDDDDRYFTDTYQFMPAAGYNALFARMVDQPNLRVELEVDGLAARERIHCRHTIFTGPIDAWFGHRFGPLPYRSLRFEHEHLRHLPRFQETGTVNFPNEHEHTRITEFKHLTGQVHPGTSIVREYPTAEGDPFYPIPRPENDALYQRYAALADTCDDVTFVGRLARYKYFNMDQVVAAALKAAQEVRTRLCPVGVP
jgi:UDP-galactopyranose mutase